MSATIRKLVKKIREAEHELWDALKNDYPPGTFIEWRDARDNARSGTVVSNCFGDRIRVRNQDTGKEMHITAARIVS